MIKLAKSFYFKFIIDYIQYQSEKKKKKSLIIFFSYILDSK